jgi:hypothetical protein
MIIRWISDVPSKIVKILEGIGILARGLAIALRMGVPLPFPAPRTVHVAHQRNAERLLLAELDSRDAAAAMHACADEIESHATALAGLQRAISARVGRLDPPAIRPSGVLPGQGSACAMRTAVMGILRERAGIRSGRCAVMYSRSRRRALCRLAFAAPAEAAPEVAATWPAGWSA